MNHDANDSSAWAPWYSRHQAHNCNSTASLICSGTIEMSAHTSTYAVLQHSPSVKHIRDDIHHPHDDTNNHQSIDSYRHVEKIDPLATGT